MVENVRHSALFFCLVLLLHTSCKKDVLPEIPLANDPIFSVEGEINGTFFEIIAGLDNAIMTEQVVLRNGVDYFEGGIVAPNEHVRLSIANGLLDKPGLNWSLEGVVNMPVFPMVETPLHTINVFNFSNSQAITAIQWVVDGEILTSQSIAFNSPGVYQVCGTFTFLGGGNVTLCNDLIIGFARAAEIEVSHQMLAPSEFQFMLSNTEGNVVEIEWYVNDSLFSTEVSPYLYASTEHNVIRCEVKLDNDVVRSREIYVHRSEESNYVQDFGSFEKGIDLTLDFHVNLDVDLTFGSYKAIPSSNATVVEIKEVMLYESQNNKDIYRIKAQYNGLLLNKDSQQLVDAQIILNFALPMLK